jgi:hypothetical protein
VCVGLGFEAKMAAALMVVPAIAAAWLWIAPRGRLRAVRQLLAGAAAMVAVGGAWPLLVALTPAADRPWISGTADNSIWSLILGYNGLGRIFGQAGGPGGGAGPGAGGGGGGGLFGGEPGPLRLLNASLGGQGGWLLGFAAVAGIGLLATTRLHRADARTGWLIAVGGAFAVTALAFSQAAGIFHPYYVSLLAPFGAALVGAGAGQILRGDRAARVLGPLAIAGGGATEIVVLHHDPGQFPWLPAMLVVGGLAASVALAARGGGTRVRRIALGAALGLLLLAPASWAFQTLGHATNGTFPSGGPASAGLMGGGLGGGRVGSAGGPGGPGGPGGGRVGSAGGPGGPDGGRLGGPVGGPGGPGRGPGGGLGHGQSPRAAFGGGPPAGAPGLRPGQAAAGVAPRSPSAPGAGGPFGGDTQSLTAALRYVRQHGGTIAVSSQSGAAGQLITSGADVAAIGGFSGRESEVSVAWLADAVDAQRIRWVVTGGASGGVRDGRAGSTVAMAAVGRACTPVSSIDGLYDCARAAAALRARA